MSTVEVFHYSSLEELVTRALYLQRLADKRLKGKGKETTQTVFARRKALKSLLSLETSRNIVLSDAIKTVRLAMKRKIQKYRKTKKILATTECLVLPELLRTFPQVSDQPGKLHAVPTELIEEKLYAITKDCEVDELAQTKQCAFLVLYPFGEVRVLVVGGPESTKEQWIETVMAGNPIAVTVLRDQTIWVRVQGSCNSRSSPCEEDWEYEATAFDGRKPYIEELQPTKDLQQWLEDETADGLDTEIDYGDWDSVLARRAEYESEEWYTAERLPTDPTKLKEAICKLAEEVGVMH